MKEYHENKHLRNIFSDGWRNILGCSPIGTYLDIDKNAFQ